MKALIFAGADFYGRTRGQDLICVANSIPSEEQVAQALRDHMQAHLERELYVVTTDWLTLTVIEDNLSTSTKNWRLTKEASKEEVLSQGALHPFEVDEVWYGLKSVACQDEPVRALVL